MRAAIQVGQLVCSIGGQDKGKLYLVIGKPEGNRLLVADGKERKIEKAKKKNIKHLKKLPLVATEVAAHAAEEQLSNKIIYNIISMYLQSNKVFGEEKGRFK